MRRSCSLSSFVGPALLLCAAAGAALAQGGSEPRGPKFLLASASPAAAPVVVEAGSVASLRRRVGLSLDGVTVSEALAEISRVSGLQIVYADGVVAGERRVHLKADEITVAAALIVALLDAGVDVVLLPGGSVVLVKSGLRQTGSVSGRVTDAKTGQGVPSARVTLNGTGLGGLTNDSGGFRITNVPPGTYTLTVRRVGYAQGLGSVTVVADEEAVSDVSLELSASPLDAVVVTGTLVPTEVKALPTPVSVITAEDFARQRPHSVQELFRQAVPTAVAWDMPASPTQTTFAVRGASTLVSGLGSMKVFVDGLPVASNTIASVDPNSIERVEVIRGPQAAAIYGSDALGGVLNIFTKRGDSTSTRPVWDGEAAFGAVQTPNAGYGSVMRQAYRGSVAGGGPGVSYEFGAGYTHTPDWVAPVSAQAQVSVHGGVRVARGILTADVSGRSYAQRVPTVYSPELAATGYSYFSKPFYLPSMFRQQTLAAKVTLAPTRWWQHTVTLGFDRLNNDGVQTQPRLTTPGDTFFTAFSTDLTKATIAYNSSIQGHLGVIGTGSLTVGFDHYSMPYSGWSTAGARSTSASTGNFGLAPVSRQVTDNTGYFAQTQLGLWEALFLTGGVRAEQNTNFGDALGTPVSPQAGLTYVRPLGSATLKLRGSWGRAIRPPNPGAKLGGSSPTSITRPNPDLRPEQQRGWDAGVDAVFGRQGSLSVTYFNQTAKDLIAKMIVNADTTPLIYQYQNVGRVKNTGVEVEASVALGMLSIRGQYGYVHSRIEDPGAATDLLPGDEFLATPTHTAGVSLSLAPRSRTTLVAGVTFVGESVGYDTPAYFRCLAGTGPCPSPSGPGLRPYRMMLPSLFKMNATISQQLPRGLTAFVSVDNLTNSTEHEFALLSPVMGRITTVGLQSHW